MKKFTSTSLESYKEFKEQNKNIKITAAQFRSIIRTFNQFFVDHLLETGERLPLTHGLGYIEVVKYKPNTKRYLDPKNKCKLAYHVDWVATKKAGKYIYNLNSHTDGYKYYFKWGFSRAYFRMSYVWAVKIVRKHSRRLASILKNLEDPRRHLYREFNNRNKFKYGKY